MSIPHWNATLVMPLNVAAALRNRVLCATNCPATGKSVDDPEVGPPAKMMGGEVLSDAVHTTVPSVTVPPGEVGQGLGGLLLWLGSFAAVVPGVVHVKMSPPFVLNGMTCWPTA